MNPALLLDPRGSRKRGIYLIILFSIHSPLSHLSY
jgi:hypothetical protein